MNELKKGKIRCLVLVADPVSNPFFRLRKHENLLYRYVDSDTVRISKKIARDLNNKWNAINEKIKIKLFTFHEESYWGFLKNEINFLFSRETLFLLVQYYLTFKKIIQQSKPQIVYLTGLTGFHEVPFVCAACKLNKKILYSIHAYGSAFPRYVPKEYRENILFVASGEDEKEELLNFGGIKRNIFITGSPFFDRLAEFKLKKKEKKGKIVCFLTQSFAEEGFVDKNEYFAYMGKFLEQINKAKNVSRVIIKLHPHEKHKSEYEFIVKSKKMKNVEVLQRSGKEFLYSILSRSDLLVSFGTTADIEGMMLDKDVIIIEGLTRFPFYRKKRYEKALIHVKKDDDLTSVVERIINDEKTRKKLEQKRKKLLKRSFYKIDGKSYKRVADLITSFIRREKYHESG